MRIIVTMFLLLVAGAVASHGTSREREAGLGEIYQSYAGTVTNLRIKPEWDEGAKRMIYKRTGKSGWQYISVDTRTGVKSAAFDHYQLAQLSSEEQGRLEVEKWIIAEASLKLRLKGQWYHWDGTHFKKADKPVKKSNNKKGKKSKRRKDGVSPDGKWRVEFRQHNVVLVGMMGERVLSTDGESSHYYHGVIWAPDSSKFAVWKTQCGQRRTVSLVESSPKDQLQPKVHTVRYDKPGDRIDTSALFVFYVDGADVFEPDYSLIQNPFYLRNPAWRSDSNRLTYEYVERGFGEHSIIEANAQTRKHRALVQEVSDTYVFVNGNGFRHDCDDGEEILWTSERDGWNHLYLLNGQNGKVKKQLTQGAWVVHRVVEVDEERRRVLFVAGGRELGQDPYFKHWYWVNFDGTGLVHLTPREGTHQLEFSPNKEFYLDSFSSVDRAPVHQLRCSVDGSLVAELESVSTDELEKLGWRAPQPFHCKDRNGKHDIWGYVLFPHDFDKTKTYPVIEQIYAGPHDQHVGKDFSVWHGAASDMAHLGFIVVRIDGLGTGKRCKEFSHFCYKNLVDAGFPDRIKWIKQAAKKYPQMDTDRVGIFGGSAGGQNSTGALLFHGDFYKVAVSDCGCHDNRMDKIWWNEQWMDWPLNKHYAEQSNIVNAGRLTGELMLTVGELDKNVDPASTMQLADALIKADKDFELIVIPGKGHGAGESLYAKWRRVAFFEKHLLGR